MQYIEGLVAAVPTKNKDKFVEHARAAAAVFKAHGAIQVVECWGDDIPSGEITSFPMAVKCKADETVVFSWIVWRSREARNAGMEAVMNDPRMSEEENPMPFDGTRLIYGGFQKIMDE